MRLSPDIEEASKLDDDIAKQNHLKAFQPHMWTWSLKVRNALGIPIASLAQRLGITKQAVSKLEQSEAAGTISLAKLEAIASALDCDFVYGFVPRHSFAKTAEQIQMQQNKARQSKRKIPAP